MMSGLSLLHNNRGVALLLAVTVISLLVAITLQFNRDMRQELVSSANLRDTGRLGVMVKSGYNVGVAVLQEDEDNVDSGHDDWAALEVSDLSQLFGVGNLQIVISDLGGKLQINSLVARAGGQGGQSGNSAQKSRAILKRLLVSGDLGERSEEEAELIIAAIVDWIDADENETGIDGAESNYYLSRQPSYSCKNGPLDFIEELLLVRGITNELFYGTEESIGLRDLVTVHGDDGKININTAPAAILKALSDYMTDESAENLISFRQDPDNKEMLKNASWYASIPLGGATFDADTIKTSSSYFRVLSRADYNQMERTLQAVVQRQKDGSIVMISRKVE